MWTLNTFPLYLKPLCGLDLKVRDKRIDVIIKRPLILSMFIVGHIDDVDI